MNTNRILIPCTIAVLAMTMQACGSKSSKSLRCTDPVDGQVITNADDINAALPGIQIEVACTVRGFDLLDELVLTVDEEDGTPRDYSMYYDGTGEVWFSPVTVQGGPADAPAHYTLVASGDEGGVTSAPVAIDVVAENSCPGFDWIEPTDTEVWIQTDDADDDATNGFQHDVIITTDAGSDVAVTLYINDALVDSGTVDGTLITFEDVTFPSGVDEMVMRIQTTESCTSTATAYLDIEAPLCNITAPVATDPAGWLNSTHDAEAAAGMQVDIAVETEDGATVELFVDIPLTSDATDTDTAGSSGEVAFDSVELEEADFGEVTIQARCTDTNGNQGFSTLNSFGVDSVLPELSITEPTGGEFYNDDADVDDSRTGIQIDVFALTNQPEGSAVNFYACDDGPDSSLVPEGIGTVDDEGIATGEVHLGGVSGPVDICAVITKPSGNSVIAGPVTVTIDTDMPQLQVMDPDGASPILNADDEDAAAGCQYTVTVECDSVGYDVHFYDEIAGDLGNSPCVTDSGSSLGGSAVFQVTLPEGDLVVYADLTDGAGNTGESSHVAVTVKSALPVLSWNIPSSCPWDLYSAASAFDTVRVQSNASPVTLSVLDGSSAHVGSSPYSVDVSGVFATFTNVEFPPGNTTMQACATDSYSQTGCSTICTTIVHDIPRVIFTDPTDGGLIGIDDDLAGGAGCQVDVTFTADVAAGNSTELFVESASIGTATYGASGVTYATVTLPEGTAVSIEGCATDTRGTGCQEIIVTCDVTAPDTISVLNSAIVVPDGRRNGQIELSWDAPGDSGAIVAGYEIVCSTSDITSSGEFDALLGTTGEHAFSGIVVAPGSPQTQVINGLAIEKTHYCSVRAVDTVGNVAIIAPSTNEILEFLSSSVDGPTGSASYTGWAVTALGDVNGDVDSLGDPAPIDDFAVGTFQNTVYIYFGEDGTIPDATADVTITSPSGVAFGARVAGIGRFNDDDLNDIAIADYRLNDNKGALYIYLGRETWPAALTDADADLIFRMMDPSSTNDDGAYFGTSLDTAGDFNNDGLDDILVGAQYWSTDNGRAFILLGRDPMPAFGTVIDVPGDLTTGLVGDFQIPSPLASGKLGTGLSAAGPLNNDLFDDVIIGAPSVTGSGENGRAYLIYGRSSAGSGLTTIATPNVTLTSTSTGENRFGERVAGLGDYNGDTYNDVAVGSTFYPDGSSNSGAIYVYLNNSGTGPDTTVDETITNDAGSSNSGDWLGYVIARGWSTMTTSTFDIDINGIDDFLYSSAKYDGGESKVLLDLGSSSYGDHGISSASIILDGMTDAGGSLISVSYAGDVNHDGFVDILLGNPRHNSLDGGFMLYY